MPGSTQPASRPDPAFSGYLADTQESRRIHQRIRYQVYCERKGFEDNPLLRRRGLERDVYDAHSLPFIIHDDRCGRWRGTARIIVRGTTDLPVEALGAVSQGALGAYAPGTIAEVSRVAALPAPGSVNRDRWGMLKATLGTVTSCAQYFGIETLLFLITPALARVTRHLGIDMEPLGQPVDHRGERRLYAADVTQALAALDRRGARPGFLPYSNVSTPDREQALA